MKKNSTTTPEKKHVPKWLQTELTNLTVPFVDKMIDSYRKENLGWNRFGLQSMAEQIVCMGYFYANPNPPEEIPESPTPDNKEGIEDDGFTGYENMPKWHTDNYASYRAWAKDCFDAGKKELQEENKALLKQINTESDISYLLLQENESLKASNEELREALQEADKWINHHSHSEIDKRFKARIKKALNNNQ